MRFDLFTANVSLPASLRQKYESSHKHSLQSVISRALLAVNQGYIGSLSRGYDHPRWWEFSLPALTSEPTDIDYKCDAKLGSPGMGDCEAVLYEMIRDGDILLDPSNGPTIQRSGNCAIEITSTQGKQLVSWSSLRSVAETLVATCLVSPFAGARGGRATPKRIRGRRWKESSSWKRETSLALGVEMVLTSPSRPSDRELLANETVIDDGEIPQIVNATTVPIPHGNISSVDVGNLTYSLAGSPKASTT